MNSLREKSRRRIYCASATIPPAKNCQPAGTLIGKFSSFKATSACR
jgi:hypothetical protein